MSLLKCRNMNHARYDLFAISVVSVMLGYVYPNGDKEGEPGGRHLNASSVCWLDADIPKVDAVLRQIWI